MGGGELGILESFVSLFFASRPVCLAEADKDGAAALLPSASQSGDQRCSLGWAGGGGTLRGFGSALIRVIITTGTHRHASICCWQPRLLRLSPWSEVIMRPAVLHCEAENIAADADKPAIVTLGVLVLAWMPVMFQCT